ncbi:MAG: hypothetical protein HXX08_07125 [Chloroflexi bacterium]|uniref:Bacterial transcriptional activator domain-containing protein n=1 Tax=Candidatus Chlorohelix allophototropha TaxID=3003348 RepID=A0A8T7LUD9_9CHLR|nr:hypothetical protein [Chloroflexota bacterium]WJW67505.1 hypothetical protein OZ401_000771 [Chloroflexota bacterium L227-S17]
MSFGDDLILRTRLIPPRLRRWTLNRARLLEALEGATDYRLTILEAPTGYGKSTLLTSWLVSGQRTYAWYSLAQFEFDPFLFLLHLIYAFHQTDQAPGARALEVLERDWNEAQGSAEKRIAYRPALQVFINELATSLTADTFLVLDDFHFLEGQTELLRLAEELISVAPPNLHIIISTRSRPSFELLARWQVQQEMLFIDKDALAFTPEETARLFDECYGFRLSESQAIRLSSETEGWIIALQMVWQNLQGENSTVLESILKDLPRNLSGLFDYLAQEVLSRQSPDVQRFLLESAVLRRMSGPICDYVQERNAGESEQLLRRLSENGLFIIGQGVDESESAGGRSRLFSYRYHHLFGIFLYSRLQEDPAKLIALHSRAAAYLNGRNQIEDALHHRIAAQDWTQASILLEDGLGKQLVETGQLERLEYWLTLFPASFIVKQPALALLQGDCLRLTSRFEAAQQSYRLAIARYEQLLEENCSQTELLEGLALALQGRALVFLDTVQPLAAEEWLERALEAAEASGNSRLHAMLLHDLAENKLNRGRPLEAEDLHQQARKLLGESDSGSQQDARILLRSGRLAEAVAYLERRSEGKNRHPRRAARSHREEVLILSLLYSIRGEKELAVQLAEQGIFLARELKTPFTEAVAWQRLGHALMVSGDYQRSLEAYECGLELGEQLQVRRLRAEGLMGKGLLLGSYSQGNLATAQQALEEGIQVARSAGDEWIEGFLQLSLTAVLAEHGEYGEALGTAQIARAIMENCGDRFGIILARLWAALANSDAAELSLLKAECARYGYKFLLECPSMYGPKAPETFQRLHELSAGVNHSIQFQINTHSYDVKAPVEAMLLRITTLGIFSLHRPDGSELTPRDWQREKARQLFQLLLTRREKALSKDQILESLWPESDYMSAEARFKVALNALVRALEPERSSRAQSTYIIRTGSGSDLSYMLNLDPRYVWLDAIAFEQLAAQGAHIELQANSKDDALDAYTRALELYRGDFLPGCLYEDWAAVEREKLLSLFLTTAERLTRLLAVREQWERCMGVCRLILARDNCWEEAYRMMILAQWRLGNRSAALRTYDKCVSTLAEELGIEPMYQTQKLYNEILAG